MASQMSQSQDYDQPRSASLAVNDDDDNASVTSEVNGALFASHGVVPLVDGEDEPLEADLETQGLLRVAVELRVPPRVRTKYPLGVPAGVEFQNSSLFLMTPFLIATITSPPALSSHSILPRTRRIPSQS